MGDAPQRAVVVEAHHFVERRLDHELKPARARCAACPCSRADSGSKRARNSARISDGDLRMRGERLLLHGLGRIEPGLLAIARQRAQQRRLAPRARQRQDQAVEAVALGLAGPDRGETLLRISAPPCCEIDRLAVGGAGFDVVDENALRRIERAGLELQFEIHFRIDEQAHVFQDRHRRRQRQHVAARVELAAHDVVGVAGSPIGARADDLIVARAPGSRRRRSALPRPSSARGRRR